MDGTLSNEHSFGVLWLPQRTTAFLRRLVGCELGFQVRNRKLVLAVQDSEPIATAKQYYASTG
jgi:hypothetical protein